MSAQSNVPPSDVLAYLQDRALLEAKVLIRSVTFRLQAIPDVKIGVRIWFDASASREPYHYQTSHYAQTPVQAGPYLSSRNGFATERIALEQAIEAGLVKWIEAAIREGHSPAPTWLKPAANFDTLNYPDDD